MATGRRVEKEEEGKRKKSQKRGREMAVTKRAGMTNWVTSKKVQIMK